MINKMLKALSESGLGEYSMYKTGDNCKFIVAGYKIVPHFRSGEFLLFSFDEQEGFVPVGADSDPNLIIQKIKS